MMYYRPAREDAYGDRDDEVVTPREWAEEEDTSALEPIDILIAEEEAEKIEVVLRSDHGSSGPAGQEFWRRFAGMMQYPK